MRFLLAFLALLLVFGNAAAFSQNDVLTPGNIFVGSEVKNVTITVSNDSSVDKDLELGFIGPRNITVDFLNAPVKIESFDSVDITMRIIPDEEPKHTSYKSTLTVSLGDEVVNRQVKIIFVNKDGQTGNAEPGLNNPGTGFFSFFSLEEFGLENFGYTDLILTIIAVALIALVIIKLKERGEK